MKKIFKLFLTTIAVTLSMSVVAMADDITESTTLQNGQSYSDIVIKGSESKENPVVITINDGESIIAKSTQTSGLIGNDCITVESGYVRFEGGGSIYHRNDAQRSSASILSIKPDAHVDINGIKI